jgi:hypothetical protein
MCSSTSYDARTHVRLALFLSQGWPCSRSSKLVLYSPEKQGRAGDHLVVRRFVVRTVVHYHARTGMRTPGRGRHHGSRYCSEQRGFREVVFHRRECNDWRKRLCHSRTDWDWRSGQSEFGLMVWVSDFDVAFPPSSMRSPRRQRELSSVMNVRSRRSVPLRSTSRTLTV